MKSILLSLYQQPAFAAVKAGRALNKAATIAMVVGYNVLIQKIPSD